MKTTFVYLTMTNYQLNKNIFSFFLQPGDFNISVDSELLKNRISNTVLQNEYIAIKKRQQLISKKKTVLGSEENQLMVNHDTIRVIQKLYEIGKIKEKLIDYYKSWLFSMHLRSIVLVYVLNKYFSYGRDLYDTTNDDRTNTADSLFQLLPSVYKQSYTALALKKKIHTLINIQTGKIAPDFSAKDTSGKIISLSSLRGKNFVLLDFLASWCGACRAQFPYLKRFIKILAVILKYLVSLWM